MTRRDAPAFDLKLVETHAAKAVLERPVFPGYHVQNNRGRYLGNHVAVNAFDLALVEAAARAGARAEILAALAKAEAPMSFRFLRQAWDDSKAALLAALEAE
jgi:hypothetical protein